MCGCVNKNDSNFDNKLNVYTGLCVIYDFAKMIGGDKINVNNISNGDPHEWEPSIKDQSLLQNADIIMYNGYIETWVDKLKQTSNSKTKYINLTSEIKIIDNDPHVWLNPILARCELYKITNALIESDPNNKDYFYNNYCIASQKIDELDEEIRSHTNNFAEKKFVVAHGAYRYFCNEYGLKQIAVEGIQENSEPTAEHIKNIINFIKKNRVNYIFYDGAPTKTLQMLAKETNTKLLELNTCEHLTKKEIDNGFDYFSVMKINLNNLITALN
jgi:zinc transport system substrate-binding protein